MKSKLQKNKKIKLMYVVQNLSPGGLEKLVVELAKRVNRDIFQPSVCCLLPPGPIELYKELAEEAVKVTYMHKKEGLNYALFPRLFRLFKQERIDLIHSHSSTANFYSSVAAWMAGIKNVINTEHGGIYFETNRKKLINRFLPLLNKKMVCVSESLRKDLEEMKLAKDKLMVIPNGIDFDSFGADVDLDAKRKELGLNRQDFVVSTVGRLEKVKNQRLLLNSADKVLAEIPEAKFLIVGAGSLREELEEYAVSLDMGNKVIFLEHRQDVAQILSISNCFVNCSNSETFGLSIIEAMFSGVPVIATEVGGVKEIIQDNETGILIPKEDKQALIEAILRIKEDAVFSKKLTANAKEKVKANYSIERMVNDYESLYLTCCNGMRYGNE